MMKHLLTPRSLALLVLAISLLFQSSVLHALFPTQVFFKYETSAQQYLQRELNGERLLDLSPLYLALHVNVRKYTPQPRKFLLWFHLLLNALSAILLFGILARQFGRLLAFTGVLAFLSNRSILLYLNIFEPEQVMIFLVLGMVFWTMRPGVTPAFLAGVCLSLCILTRANFLPMLVIIPLFFWLTRCSNKQAFRMVLVFILPSVVALTALSIRNSAIAGSFTPFSMNPGYVFFEGNNPNSQGESAIHPPLVDDARSGFRQTPDFQHEMYRIFARRITGRQLTVAEVNAYWSQKAKNFIFEHPAYFLKQLWHKMFFFFHNYRRHDLSNVYWNDQQLQQSWVPCVPYALIASLALLGLLLALPQWKQHLVLYGVLLSQFGIMMLTYVSDRQRVVIVSVMIFFAVKTLHVIREQRNKALFIGGLAILLASALYVKSDLMHDDDHTWNRYALSSQYVDEAHQAREQQQWRLAAEKNAFALALAPGLKDHKRLARLSFAPEGFYDNARRMAGNFPDHSFSVLFDLALLSLESGELETAESIFREIIRGKYQFNRQYDYSSQPYFYLARIALLQNNVTQALEFLEKGRRKNPGDPWLLSYSAALSEKPKHREQLFRYFDELDAEFFMGQAYIAAGKYAEAVRSFSFVVSLLPEYRRGRIYLSIALGLSGDYTRAAHEYLKARTQRKEPLLDETQLISIFRQWTEREPESFEARYALGKILGDFGHYEDALALHKELLQSERFPLSRHYQEEILSQIRWLENAMQQQKESVL